MELTNDNWRVIFGYLTPNDLIQLKGVNKHLLGLIRQSYGNKFKFSIFEVFYFNHFSLFTDYLYSDQMDLKDYREQLSYCAGLGCSTKFTIWLKKNKLLNTNELLKGALRSADKSFIKYVYDLGVRKCVYKWILRSLSTDIVDQAPTMFSYGLHLEFNITDILPDKLEKRLGFRPNITAEYILYLLRNIPNFTQNTLFKYLLTYDVSIARKLLESGYTPDSNHLKSVLLSPKPLLDLADSIIKISPSCLETCNYVVNSQVAYEYATVKSIDIDTNKTLIIAMKSRNKEFVTYLYSKGIVFTDDMLERIYCDGKRSVDIIDMIYHVISLGYCFPSKIYEFMNERGCICIDLHLFNYLHEHGYYDPAETPIYIFNSCETDVVKAYIDMNLDIPADVYTYVVERDDYMKIIDYLLEKGEKLPEDICDLIASSCYDCLENIQYLMDLGYKVTETVLTRMIETADIEGVKFMINQVPVTMKIILEVSVYNEMSEDRKKEIMEILVETYASYNK